ncbi:type II toxin-antitoxin system Phd/YefM family antitoxin [Phycicoccus sp.]|uniref:type II toxin-antitoxin system Phd/YefM family antitoxin n=1 Tax=Phycicoccus sp. TaxID=1902410 RepID=UPI00345E09BD
MPTIASRDLRNHTSTVLDGVARGEVYTVTVHGRPVAELHRVSSQRRPALPKDEVLALLDRQRPDAALAADMAWISEGTTDDLGDLG